MDDIKPLVIINAVGLTPELFGLAAKDSALAKLARRGGASPITGTFPALTLPAQASILTGQTPGGANGHGVTGNGWYRPDLGEVRFWSQAFDQIRGDTVQSEAKRLAAMRGQDFTIAHHFWWFAQGAPCDYMATPKPHYGADGSKAFDVLTHPPDLAHSLTSKHGSFPFHTFWGPMSGIRSSQWIAATAAQVMEERRPTLMLCYLPHLDYDLQRFGPSALRPDGLKRLVSELDACIAVIVRAAEQIGAGVLVISEYGITDVSRVELPNLALREAGLLSVRDGPFGEMLDPTASAAFAVCDHQIAHVYCKDESSYRRAEAALRALPGVADLFDRAQQARLQVDPPHRGSWLVTAKPDSWFAYPYWLDAKRAPDFARTIDIHRKPGYDPCELFFDPKLVAPKLRMAFKLGLKKLGFRALLDVIPLDPTLVKGSHGLVMPEGLGAEAAQEWSYRQSPMIVTSESILSERILDHRDVMSAVLDYYGFEREKRSA